MFERELKMSFGVFGAGTNLNKFAATGSKQVVGILLPGKILVHAGRLLGSIVAGRTPPAAPIAAAQPLRFCRTASRVELERLPPNGEAEKSPVRSVAVGTTTGSEVTP